MNWLLVSVVAQIILGTSAVFDKLLLRKKFADPWTYTFWASVLSLFIIILIPFFGFYSISLPAILIGIAGGAVFSLALFFFFWALREGEASVALPTIGGLAPVFTLIISIPFLNKPLTPLEIFGFLILVAGSTLVLGAEQKGFRIRVFVIALISAFLFGISNVLTKLLFETSPFITGMVWQKIGGALLVLGLLFKPRFRTKIALSLQKSETANQTLYIINRIYAAIGGILVSGAIFLAHPALVDASSGLRYAVTFLGAWFILRETFRGRELVIKTFATLLIIAGILWLGLVNYIQNYPPPTERQIFWGVTFSQKASSELGLDWKENYKAILKELRPNGIRLIAYWDIIEPEKNKWNFEDLDWQMKEAERAGIPVILAIGQKVPRWPECHVPAWAREIQNSKNKSQNDKYKDELLKYLDITVNRYRDYPNLLYWQVENEPFLFFGECPYFFVAKTLDEEIKFVKNSDPVHPILITDGGEGGDWYRAAKRGDVFGASLYRKVYNDFLGYFTYPLPPGFYPWKENIIRRLTGKPKQKFIVIELSLEPWIKEGLFKTKPEKQLQFFNIKDFEDSITYAKAAGFDTYYLWGAEWWYWMKTAHNDSIFWDAAKNLIRSR